MQDNDIDGSGGAASGGMTAPQTVADVLDAAADLLEKPGAWTQGWTAKGPKGEFTYALSPIAVCWCAAGAIIKAYGADTETTEDATVYFRRTVGCPIGRFNDAPGRIQSEVVAALRAAANFARQETRHGE